MAGTCAAQVVEAPAVMEQKLAPGEFEELCFALDAGESVKYTFDADAPLEFNLHWHRGNELRFPVRLAAVARLGGVFRSPEKQAYCLMWTNHGRGVVPLRARIDRAQ